jgi:hypothetical protein
MRRNSLGSQTNQFTTSSSPQWSSAINQPSSSANFAYLPQHSSLTTTDSNGNGSTNNQLTMLESQNLKSLFMGTSSQNGGGSGGNDHMSSLVLASSPNHHQNEIANNQENNISNLLNFSNPNYNDLYSFNSNYNNNNNNNTDSCSNQLNFSSTPSSQSMSAANFLPQYLQQQQQHGNQQQLHQLQQQQLFFQHQQQLQQQQYSIQQQALQAKLNMRRKTYGPSSLSTVMETTRSSSPNSQNRLFSNSNYQDQMLTQQIQQQLIEQKLSQLQSANSGSPSNNNNNNGNVNQFLVMSMNQNSKLQGSLGPLGGSNPNFQARAPFQHQQQQNSSFMHGPARQLNAKSSSTSSSNDQQPIRQRPRAFSVQNASAAAALSCLKSFDMNNNIQSASANTSTSGSTSFLYGGGPSTSTGNLYTPTSLASPNCSKVFFDSNDEKLATTGNIFQRREDWSILKKLPVSKQNTVHIRVEDEGPYGNDETRCFVLSHFSSLNIKEINCLFCDCELVIYDRFPLVDGTLFVSPFMYDKARSIPSVVSNKQQYINAVCLKCMMCKPDHEIKCMHCSTSWQSCGGDSFQIGTLYKFDLFAALPCCQRRLTCLNCDHNMVDIKNARESPEFYFSWFSEEKQCESCRVKAFHFVKPLKEIYAKSACETKRDEQLSKEYAKDSTV